MLHITEVKGRKQIEVIFNDGTKAQGFFTRKPEESQFVKVWAKVHGSNVAVGEWHIDAFNRCLQRGFVTV